MALTLQQARKAVAASQSKAKELGVSVTTAVVDQGGHLLALERMDGVGWLTPDIAYGKAFTAAAFRRTTEATAQAGQANPQWMASIVAFTSGRVVPAMGGVPITVNGEVVGGVGISGATSETEAECATAAVNAID